MKDKILSTSVWIKLILYMTVIIIYTRQCHAIRRKISWIRTRGRAGASNLTGLHSYANYSQLTPISKFTFHFSPFKSNNKFFELTLRCLKIIFTKRSKKYLFYQFFITVSRYFEERRKIGVKVFGPAVSRVKVQLSS